jgi:uncharacterized protein
VGKIIFWIGIFAAIYMAAKAYAVIQRKGALAKDQEKEREAQRNAKSADAKSLSELVVCAKCGVHLPKGEALEKQQKFFCSKEHAD